MCLCSLCLCVSDSVTFSDSLCLRVSFVSPCLRVSVVLLPSIQAARPHSAHPQATLEQVQALSTVHHPNLATILGYLPSPSADDRLAFVISVYTPITLAAWMDSSAMLGPYTEKLYVKRLTVLGHVAKGVAFLHSRGVVHGAIGTSTVLIEDRRYVSTQRPPVA